jgi:hypothetical protein
LPDPLDPTAEAASLVEAPGAEAVGVLEDPEELEATAAPRATRPKVPRVERGEPPQPTPERVAEVEGVEVTDLPSVRVALACPGQVVAGC